MEAVVHLVDLKCPPVRMTLGGGVLIGSKLMLDFVLPRVKGGRKEELRVKGPYQVRTVETLQGGLVRVEVTAMGEPPSWRAVKGTPNRPLSPARAPRTPLSE